MVATRTRELVTQRCSGASGQSGTTAPKRTTPAKDNQQLPSPRLTRCGLRTRCFPRLSVLCRCASPSVRSCRGRSLVSSCSRPLTSMIHARVSVPRGTKRTIFPNLANFLTSINSNRTSSHIKVECQTPSIAGQASSPTRTYTKIETLFKPKASFPLSAMCIR